MSRNNSVWEYGSKGVGEAQLLPRYSRGALLAFLFPLFSQVAALSHADECATMQPGWLFCNEFENGNFSVWDDFDGNPAPSNTLLADPGPLNQPGNHVARLYVPPGRGGADVVKVLPAHNKIYARWYEYWEPGYVFTTPNHGGGLHAGDRNLLGHSDTQPNGTDWFSTWLEPTDASGTGRMNLYSYYHGMYMDCSDPNGSCWGDHFPCMAGAQYCTNPSHNPPPTPPAMQTGRWYCFEVMLDAGNATSTASGATGAQDFWMDGIEYGPWTGLWHRTSSSVQPNLFFLATFFHGAHPDVGVRFDNAVVSTQRIGCAGTPPPLNRCDVNTSGTVDVSDVQQCVNQSISILTCGTADINQDSQCNVVDVQRVVNAALGGPCVTQ